MSCLKFLLAQLQVIQPNLAIEKVSYFERENLWIGPRQADLIHMGAKYSPCMRKDANVERILAEARSIESQTACCVRNDGSGCLQTIEDKCSVSTGQCTDYRSIYVVTSRPKSTVRSVT